MPFEDSQDGAEEGAEMHDLGSMVPRNSLTGIHRTGADDACYCL